MLKAYSVFKNLDKKTCEILINTGIQLDLSNLKRDLIKKNY